MVDNIFLKIASESGNFSDLNSYSDAPVEFDNVYEEMELGLEETIEDTEAAGESTMAVVIARESAQETIEVEGEVCNISSEAGVAYTAQKMAYAAKGGISRLVTAVKNFILKAIFRMGASDGNFKKLKTTITSYKNKLGKNSKLKADFTMKYKDYTPFAKDLYSLIEGCYKSLDGLKDSKDAKTLTAPLKKFIEEVFSPEKFDFALNGDKAKADKLRDDLKAASTKAVSTINDKFKEVKEVELTSAGGVTIKKDLETLENLIKGDFKFKALYAKVDKIFNNIIKDASNAKEDKSASVVFWNTMHNAMKETTTVINKEMWAFDRCVNETMNQAAKLLSNVQA